ncbi:hypothetical protein MIR68_004357 [Amoeboaphelidium protococcarum]|nr:hypothetical protein MIR68_004357 [Amoeboaphelidium protococcarum]
MSFTSKYQEYLVKNTVNDFSEFISEHKKQIKKQKKPVLMIEFFKECLQIFTSELELNDKWRTVPECYLYIAAKVRDHTNALMIKDAQFQIILAFQLLRSLFTLSKSVKLQFNQSLLKGHGTLDIFLPYHIEELFGVITTYFSCNFYGESGGNESLSYEHEQQFLDRILKNSTYSEGRLEQLHRNLESKFSTNLFSPAKTQPGKRIKSSGKQQHSHRRKLLADSDLNCSINESLIESNAGKQRDTLKTNLSKVQTITMSKVVKAKNQSPTVKSRRSDKKMHLFSASKFYHQGDQAQANKRKRLQDLFVSETPVKLSAQKSHPSKKKFQGSLINENATPDRTRPIKSGLFVECTPIKNFQELLAAETPYEK